MSGRGRLTLVAAGSAVGLAVAIAVVRAQATDIGPSARSSGLAPAPAVEKGRPQDPREAVVPAGAAYFVKSLADPADRREARADVLDTPVLPGSIAKALTLVAALESQLVDGESSRLCRRTTTVNGRRYVCAHPDVKRPLNAAEALAHSCNDFFVSLAARLPRGIVNDVRRRAGLAPIDPRVDYAAALVGLDGPRVTPRALIDILARLVGADPDRPMALPSSTRRVLIDGLKGAADYGTASALGARRISGLAKTGTAPMPGGSWMGLVVALTPADRPTRGIVVVAPGAAGVDAASIAADLLTGIPPLSGGSQERLLKTENGRPGSSTSRGGSQDPPQMIRVGAIVSGRVSITRVDLEDYIAQVVAGEGEPRAAAAAQQALAITARTFALANLNRHAREGYDFCDTTHCQVFRPATEASRAAVAATAGRVLQHQGQPATVFYSALCGGHSELASHVWPGAFDYGARTQEDEACAGEPAWESDVRVDQIERALRDAGHRGIRLRNLRVVSRNASGRVARLQVDGFTPPEISGHDFRMAVGRVAGWQRLKSTAFDVQRIGVGYRFRGRGFGHGVGLCVIGAGRRAAGGGTAEAILRFYFPTLQVGPVSTLTVTRAVTPSRPGPTDVQADVRVGLPAGEEGERGRLLALVRRARDDIGRAASRTPPASITITVHPTVEAFARSTGQPWWVSGTTAGTTIELLPLTVLRQRGLIESTIRHEVAHVLIDGVLADRPLWVREGAASYFASGAASDATSGRRPSCPQNEEFTRPLSAGAHRAAYARAEACFRHAIRGGRDWREVR